MARRVMPIATALLLSLIVAACSASAPRRAANVDFVSPSMIARVVSYNIHHGLGMDDSVNLERTARVLRTLQADIAGLQEVDSVVQRSGGVDQAAVLGEMLGMDHAFGAFMPYDGGRYGMAILSKFPIVRSESVRLPEGNEPRVALAAEIRMPDSSSVMVVNVHFDWVESDSFRFAQAEALAEYLDGLTMPFILLGDFNDGPESRTLALFQARATEVDKPVGNEFTFPSDEPIKEIDFVFVSPAERWTQQGARPIGERRASDHRPVLAVVQLVPSR